MNIFSKIFGKKNKVVDAKVKENKPFIEPRDFDIEEFNTWFKTEYSGYGGQKGAPGIFLRLDKLSDYCITEYLRHIGQDDSYENTVKHRQIIRNDWMKKLHK